MKIDKSLRTGDGGGGFYSFLWQPLNHNNLHIYILEKLVYLAYRNIRKKWTMPLANWATISQQLAIKFGNRFKLL